ncbi:MAG: Coenzyme F420 hydrogenase/dehydrogenase, beta subunit C-terminal domain, partial [Lachnospiraceae bacterium]|nr:Coenzyme F420 hydrogenase/dehydrogenase, beta subunit C-terminal domain [Lachnospiraceae bacterium]
MNTVENTTSNNLCISCGICKAVCPTDCISYQREKGLWIPVIDREECIHCGKCYQVCPGKGFDYTKNLPEAEDSSFWFGEYRSVYVAWTLDEKRRGNAVSGGVVTELVYNLLENEEYGSAFLVGTHQYQTGQVYTNRYIKGDNLESSQKSRYLPVSQEKAVDYILSHREEKVILVGTGCFVEGIINIINSYHLKRENYFIIGLFCDRTMSWNVMDYFSRHSSLKGEKLDKFFFRTKDAGGWPGGVKLETDSGRVIKLSNTERMKVKDYFCPERCMYCLDKLNMFADISVGDNYTKKHSDTMGSSSVIVRTDMGMRIWEKYKSHFACRESSPEQIKASQRLPRRKENYRYATLKEKAIGQRINETDGILDKSGVSLRIRLKYRMRRFKQWVGNHYEKAVWMLAVRMVWE